MVNTMAPLARLLGATLALSSAAFASPYALTRRQSGTSTTQCPGYQASDVQTSSNGLTAKLALAGSSCNVYGTDIKDLTLTVEYQTDNRLHVLIQDAAQQVYQVPESVFPRPTFTGVDKGSSNLVFDYVESPFSFTVKRKSSGEVLFDTSAASLIFEDQYVRLRTSLPEHPSLYGTGEHTDPFMLNTTNYTRTAWNRDAYGTPAGTNLYSTHPVYYDHRGANGTHAVFLLSSNGMNYKIDDSDGTYLEYDLLGGVLDFYFVAGPTPVEVSQQYSEIVGKSAMQPYWGFGFHQCRYGYQDVYNVAEVVANYSAANIPLETMWTDIDYMHLRRVFTLDPDRFPLDLMRELVSTLHAREQHYIVMVDPAVAYQDYDAFNNGVNDDIFMKKNGSIYKGVVWPGVTAFPDWFHPSAQSYWNGEFTSFFSADTGIDIDGLWIDMNDPSNFCNYPCTNPEQEAQSMGDPPRPPAVRLGSPRPIAGFGPDFQPVCKAQITFNVVATTFFGENILVYGNVSTIGDGDITNAASLAANNYPTWSATIDVPANTVVAYQYVRAEPDGTYVYEASNHTITTGDCNSIPQATNDTITTTSPAQSSKIRRFADFSYQRHQSLPNYRRQATGDKKGLPGRDLINPPYNIGDAAGSLSNKTADTDIVLYNGLVEYDTHNVYGFMMSEASRIAMLARRPTLRPLIITRSTYAGAGAQVGKWLGDNFSDWFHYLISIKENLEFNAMYQVAMIGADVCGYGSDTNENLCARWAMLGAFYPFYRNHNENDAISQEFYIWPIVTSAAQNAIEIRYKLLDYFYTAFYHQNQTGAPSIQPMFYHHPNDSNTFALGYQFYYGPGLLVAPVTEENSTTTTFYLPDEIYYDYYTHATVQGAGAEVTRTDIAYDSIPLYYKGGNILAQRVNSANTTTELRKQNFELIIAPGRDGTAEGDLYLDDGVSEVQKSTSVIHFSYSSSGDFHMTGQFGYGTSLVIESITVLGTGGNNTTDATQSSKVVSKQIPLTQEYEAQL
ncbi:glycoside hydrolase family 31 protein [Dothistroma septosporum NZE10]|uniref:Glycoside hydrolase family 31 protein n=1 Tax=Dothistroma septosporum (strain NZE10 / CBS 128990) TaxID=675120 RepID=M2YJ89_DOTSN|nr:glycoside hydrolase family 31 protein [Dothistroma septosporum NZE10]